ncbi:hypothetical protein LB505_010488 [Fusarium chuoi]|nr:hypothetical protein LB505_010488 [Fusarium chuoi]
MPQSPARTKSWWNPKGYFTEHEQKIIVNSEGRHVQPTRSDSPSNLGMHQRLRYVAALRPRSSLRPAKIPCQPISHVVLPWTGFQRHRDQPSVHSIYRRLLHHDACDHSVQ